MQVVSMGATAMRFIKYIAMAALFAVLAGCGIGNPWPNVTPTREHRTVLMIGDSLVGQNDYSLLNVMTQRGFDVTIIDAHQNGAGLLGPVGDHASALDWVKEQVNLHPDADTVVVEYAGACGVCGTETFPKLGEGNFYDLWVTQAHAIIDYLHSEGKLVVWTVSPPIGVDSPTAASGSQVGVNVSYVLSLLDRVLLAPVSDGMTDWWTALADTDGKFQTRLFYDGAIHTVRSDDLLHLTVDGSIRTATWTARALETTWADHPLPELHIQSQHQPGLIQSGDPVVKPDDR
jgi:hypothetical protein